MTVLDGTTVITNDQTTAINLGSAARGAAGPTIIVTIRNDGDKTLVLKGNSFADTAHFTVGRPGD